MTRELQGHQGQFIITKKNKITGEVVTRRVFNAITDLAINKEINALKGTNPDIQIKYLAIGTGSNPINNADTQRHD